MGRAYPDAESTTTAPPLAARYDGGAPLNWHGRTVYPVHSAALGAQPCTVTLTLRSVAAPTGVRSLGLGLSVEGGHVLLDGRRLRGVDVWTDAMSGGVALRIRPDGPGSSFSLTPVWVDPTGATVSWTGNYGMLVEPGETTVLHCSTGIGVPNFTELVVELGTAADTAAPPSPDASRYRDALYDLGVAMQGRGDEDQACQLWTQAAGFGHLGAAYDLGVVRFRHGDYAEAERWWRPAADHGDARAMSGLAEALDRQGNPSEARVWRAACAAESRSDAESTR
ncbi:tetratricopeptide repeat protein [Nocardia uniformis]|uniref:Tetratricopeptide repeat protein n=1 Tax=Nocardia uniformis TaxID=53432 RepID=A0A849BYC9_9NOCA|nr:tetratricopeptide repeat protein [Nocardia uniformis]NNH69115.1 tetratricopeptide repeat protein [Nocardia uniformis]